MSGEELSFEIVRNPPIKSPTKYSTRNPSYTIKSYPYTIWYRESFLYHEEISLYHKVSFLYNKDKSSLYHMVQGILAGYFSVIPWSRNPGRLFFCYSLAKESWQVIFLLFLVPYDIRITFHDIRRIPCTILRRALDGRGILTISKDNSSQGILPEGVVVIPRYLEELYKKDRERVPR